MIIGVLVFVPDTHQSADFVFTERINNSGLFDGVDRRPRFFWLFVLPIGFLLTMYTQTGLRRVGAHRRGDAQARRSPPPRASGARCSSPRSIGWFVLLAFLFAANDVTAVNDGAGFVGDDLHQRRSTPWAAKLVFIIATVGQLFCGMAGLTSASRTWYAFSRDRGMPGWQHLPAGEPAHRVPFYAVIAVAVARADHHDPGAAGGDEQHPVRVLRDHVDLHDRASTSPTSSRSTCGCGRATLRARTVEPRPPVQAGQHPARSSSWSLVVYASTCRYAPAGPAVE